MYTGPYHPSQYYLDHYDEMEMLCMRNHMVDIPEFPDYGITPRGEIYCYPKHEYLRQNGVEGSNRYYKVTIHSHCLYPHVLVAKIFVGNPDPEHFDCVNHVDENKHNNRADNLEWCDRKYNATYGNARIKQANGTSKEMVGIDPDGNVHYFKNAYEAMHQYGYDEAAIRRAAKDHRRYCYGWTWYYAIDYYYISNCTTPEEEEHGRIEYCIDHNIDPDYDSSKVRYPDYYCGSPKWL